MTLEEIDQYMVEELKKYNLQPEGKAYLRERYSRFFKTITRPRPDPKQPPRFATLLVSADENSTIDDLKLEINRVVQAHEQLLQVLRP